MNPICAISKIFKHEEPVLIDSEGTICGSLECILYIDFDCINNVDHDQQCAVKEFNVSI